MRRIKAYAATVPPGTWITGGDWDHTLWGGELPRQDWIDSVTPNNPVWINRLDGHMAPRKQLAIGAGEDYERHSGHRRRRRSSGMHPVIRRES